MTKKLTWEQKDIVNHGNGNALVKAVPGSGKTTTLVKRIQRLVKDGVDYRSILILMYNRSAKQSFEEKLKTVLNPKEIPEVRTFHSLAYKLVRRAENRGIINRKTLIPPHDYRYENIVRQAYREGVGHEEDYIRSEDIEDFDLFITRCRAEAITPHEADLDPVFKNTTPGYIQAYRRYCELLEASSLRTFDDVLIEASTLFQTYPNLGAKFNHIIVDEYQDVNRVQHDIIRLLAKKNASVMAVGDVNQCIYEWRGARPDFISGLFERQFSDTKVFHLSCTFRFGHALSLMANSVIRRNTGKLSSLCISHPEAPKTDVSLYDNNILPEVLSELSAASGTKAILSRTKASLAEAEMVLRLFGLPYRHHNNETSLLHRRNEIGTVVTGMLLCVYGNLQLLDDTPNKEPLIYGFLRGAGFRWKKGQLKEALNGMKAPDADLWAVLGRLFKGDHGQSGRLKKLASICHGYSEDTLASDIFKRIDEAGFFGGLDSGGVTRAGSNDRIRGIEKIENLLESRKIKVGHLLYSILNDESSFGNREPFNLSTLHASKGLEWDNVVVIGLHEDEFPGGNHEAAAVAKRPPNNSSRDGEVEELRRLFYVGITRAKHRIILSAPADERLEQWIRKGWDTTPKRPPIATRFVYETGLTACTLTSNAIYDNRLVEKDISELSKFHQWYLRDLRRLKI